MGILDWLTKDRRSEINDMEAFNKACTKKWGHLNYMVKDEKAHKKIAKKDRKKLAKEIYTLINKNE